MAFDWDDLDDTANQSSSMKQLRDHAKDLEKQLKAQAKKEAELTTQLETYRQAEKTQGVAQKFIEAGLSDKQAKLFLALNPGDEEIDLEAIQAFAEEYGLTAEEASSSTEEDDGDTTKPPADRLRQDPGFVKVPNSIATPPDGKVLSPAEFTELLAVDQNAAMAAVAEGRVQLETTL